MGGHIISGDEGDRGEGWRKGEEVMYVWQQVGEVVEGYRGGLDMYL